MSYPYGPERYPTIEKLENKYTLEHLRHAYYFGVHRMFSEKREKFDKNKVEFAVNGLKEDTVYGTAEFGNYPEEVSIEEKAIAFAHALEYALDDCENDIDRIFQDLFALLEDRVISRMDKDDGDWYEYHDMKQQLDMYKKFSEGESEFDYTDSIVDLEQKRAEFTKVKRAELEKRLADEEGIEETE